MTFGLTFKKIFLTTLVICVASSALRFSIAASISNFSVTIVPAPQCFDGQDNDGDGLTDYPNDPGCSSYTDDTEADVVTPPGGGGGGGGGGSAGTTMQTGVVLSGRAYPLSKVTVLKDGQIAASTIAGPNASFSISLTNLSAGNYTFSVYGEDDNGLKSSLFTFPVYVGSGATTEISDIYIAPTISIDKSQVKKGDNLAIFGQGTPNSNVTVSVHSPIEVFDYTQTDDNGVYLLNFDSSPLDYGGHTTKSKVASSGQISPYGRLLGFTVGEQNIPFDGQYLLPGDLNEDGYVNLIDFSIAAFWYKKPLDDSIIQREVDHLNADGKIDLVDFSIMAFHWTG